MLLVLLPASGLGQRPPSFDSIIIDPAGPEDPWGKTVSDLNGDGAPDLVVGGNKSGGLLWYENPSWTPHVISGLTGFRTDHEAGDIDGDSLPDLISLATDSVGRPWLAWFKNPGIGGTEWIPFTVDTIVLHDVEVTDLDADGLLDIAARNQELFGPEGGDTLYLYFQHTAGQWRKHRIASANGEGLKIADINRDARPDIIINASWFENTGTDTVWIERPFTSAYTYRSVTVAVEDIDGDGLVDILLSPSEPIGGSYRVSWFKAPLDPAQAEWQEFLVEDGVETVHHSIGAADFDNDGTMDIASAKMHNGATLPEVKVFLNGGQGLAWTKHVIATTGSHGIRVVDVDRNGSKDIFGANWRGVRSELWVNQPDTLTYSLQVLDETGAARTLEFGLGRYASDSLDMVLREVELPAAAPPGAFEARFVGTRTGVDLGRGTYRDFRRGDSATVGVRVHEVECQATTGASLTLSVDLPPQVSLRLQAAEPGGTFDTTLTGAASFTIPDPGTRVNILMTATYVLSPPTPPAPVSPDQGALGVEAQPVLVWGSVDYCFAYRLRVGLPGSPGAPLIADTVVADTSLQLPVLDSLTTYWWSVGGINAAGQGEMSSPWQFRTKEFVADPRTLGFWRLNESGGPTVFDLTLNANDGVAVGTTIVEGRFGTGRSFNGTSDYVDLPESPSLLDPGRKLTVEAWVRVQSFPQGGSVGAIVSTGDMGEYELFVGPDGRLQGHVQTTSGPDSVRGWGVLPLRQWAHVALTYDGSSMWLYTNGVLDGEQARSGTIEGAGPASNVLLGAASRDGQVTDHFNGRVDEARVLKIARSPDEFALQLPPSALSASAGPERVTLSWQNGGGGAPLMQYRIYRGVDSVFMLLLDSSATAMFVDSAATPLTPYAYRVSSVDSSGFEGVPGGVVWAVPLLATPRQLVPGPGQTGVPRTPAFAWTPVRFAERYQFQVWGDSSLTLSVVDTSFADTSVTLAGLLENGVRYYWRVRALHQVSPGLWAPPADFVTTIAAPLPGDPLSPVDMAVIAGDTVVCVWAAGGPQVERYWFDLATDSLFAATTIDSSLTDTVTVARNLAGGLIYWWRVRAFNAAGWGPYGSVRSFSVAPLVAVDDDSDLPLEFGLAQNYPNPFNPETAIQYQIPVASRVRLSLFDMLGREVVVLVDEWRERGKYQVTWDGTNAASGTYICWMTAGSFSRTMRMVLLR